MNWPRALLLGLAGTVLVVLGPDIVARVRAVLWPVAKKIVVAVMPFEADRLGPHDDWVPNNTRNSLNALLSRVPEIEVIPKEDIDYGCKNFHACSENPEVSKIITGTITMDDTDVILELRVISTNPKRLERVLPNRHPLAKIAQLQREGAIGVVRALGVSLTPEREQELETYLTDASPQIQQKFFEGLGDFVEDKQSGLPPAGPWRAASEPAAPWESIAYAGDEKSPDPATTTAVTSLLERYRQALVAKDLDALATLHEAMSDKQRSALAAYFANVSDLKVEFSDLSIIGEGEEALATFTRTDTFTDAATGRPARIEVRLSSVLVNASGTWRIRGLKKPAA